MTSPELLSQTVKFFQHRKNYKTTIFPHGTETVEKCKLICMCNVGRVGSKCTFNDAKYSIMLQEFGK